MTPYVGDVMTSGSSARIHGRGIVRLFVRDTVGRERVMYLTEALHVPTFAYNLLSLHKGTINDELSMTFDHTKCVITHMRVGFKVEASVGDRVDLYILPTLGKEIALVATQSVRTNSMMLWHRRLGHPGRTAMKFAYDLYFKDTNAFPKSAIEQLSCESCIFAKSSRLPYPKRATRSASRPGQVVHTDIGVLPVPSFKGNKYFVVFVDEYTRYIFVDLMAQRSDLYESFEKFRRESRGLIQYVYWTENLHSEEISTLQSDNAKEYIKLGGIIQRRYGIKMRFTQVYTPRGNGIAERRMRMIMEKVRAILYEGGVVGRSAAHNSVREQHHSN
jgi:transposase InsO family protein